MGNCAKRTQESQIRTQSKGLDRKSDQSSGNRGQIQQFKRNLSSTEDNAKIRWNQLKQKKYPKTQRRQIINEHDNRETSGILKSKNVQNKIKEGQQNYKKTNKVESRKSFEKITTKDLDKGYNNEDIENYYKNMQTENGQQKEGNEENIMQQQELPRPEAKIIKKFKRKDKNQQNIEQVKVQIVESYQKPIMDGSIIDVIQSKQNRRQNEKSLVCLQRQEIFDGICSEDKQCSRLSFRLSTSNIQFLLPKNRAGPLVASEIDYNAYCV